MGGGGQPWRLCASHTEAGAVLHACGRRRGSRRRRCCWRVGWEERGGHAPTDPDPSHGGCPRSGALAARRPRSVVPPYLRGRPRSLGGDCHRLPAACERMARPSLENGRRLFLVTRGPARPSVPRPAPPPPTAGPSDSYCASPHANAASHLSSSPPDHTRKKNSPARRRREWPRVRPARRGRTERQAAGTPD